MQLDTVGMSIQENESVFVMARFICVIFNLASTGNNSNKNYGGQKLKHICLVSTRLEQLATD